MINLDLIIICFHWPLNSIVTLFIIIISKVGDCRWGRPEGSLFNSYYTEVLGRALLLSLDCSTLPLIHTLYCWMLSKEVSSTIFKVFGMAQPGIEPRSPRPLANTLPTRPLSQFLEYVLLLYQKVSLNQNHISCNEWPLVFEVKNWF